MGPAGQNSVLSSCRGASYGLNVLLLSLSPAQPGSTRARHRGSPARALASARTACQGGSVPGPGLWACHSGESPCCFHCPGRFWAPDCISLVPWGPLLGRSCSSWGLSWPWRAAAAPASLAVVCWGQTTGTQVLNVPCSPLPLFPPTPCCSFETALPSVNVCTQRKQSSPCWL